MTSLHPLQPDEPTTATAAVRMLADRFPWAVQYGLHSAYGQELLGRQYMPSLVEPAISIPIATLCYRAFAQALSDPPLLGLLAPKSDRELAAMLLEKGFAAMWCWLAARAYLHETPPTYMTR